MVLCMLISGACCACQACQCLFQCLRCGKSSVRARTQYFAMWIFCAFLSWALRDRGYDILKHLGGMEECANSTCTGNGMVLRISFSMVMLATVIGLSVIGVKSSQNPRSDLQNGFFELKWFALIAIIIASIWMDNQDVMNFAYVCAIGSGIFLFMGIILMLEFAHLWNDTWVAWYGDGEKIWGYLNVGVSVAMYAVSIIVWVLLIVYFGGDDCNHANAFISITIVVSVIVTVLSVLEKIEQGAILPSSVMVGYATYLLSSALIDMPADNTHACTNRHTRITETTQDGVYAVGILFTIFAVGWATFRQGSQAVKDGDDKIVPSDQVEVVAEPVDDEADACSYNYSYFQATYALGAMYLAMVLINWNFSLVEEDGVIDDVPDWTPVWVKIGSQWAAFAIYFWSLIAPLVLSDRDFS